MGKRKTGYGGTVGKAAGLSLERDGQTGHWGIYEAEVTYSAFVWKTAVPSRVVARLRLGEWHAHSRNGRFALWWRPAEGRVSGVLVR